MNDMTSTKRKISADISIEQQVANLLSLIKNAPENSRICEFSPELAEYILSNININNRPRKVQKIVQYKKDMQDNNWSLTGETIKFGSDGLLKDGQNRLAACIQAQTPFTTHAIFGIDPQTFHHMDTGKNRSGEDVLSIMGVKNATKMSLLIKFLINEERGKTNTAGGASNDDVKDGYLNRYDVGLMQESISWAEKVYRQTRYPIGQVAHLYYRCSIAGQAETAEAFMNSMITGTGTSTSGPIRLLKHINSLRNMNRFISSHDYSVLISRAYYCYRNKKRMTKDMLSVNLKDKRMPLDA